MEREAFVFVKALEFNKIMIKIIFFYGNYGII